MEGAWPMNQPLTYPKEGRNAFWSFGVEGTACDHGLSCTRSKTVTIQQRIHPRQT